ncbi:MAG TPA: accessory factor UbiK family protein [Rhizomicrobium sp.]|nr:accessory factor UbiK family protein [Rhizomicrobium sp.]
MQTDNPFLDGMAKLFTDAAGAANSVRTEIESIARQRMERLVADMNLVHRDEFETVKAMAAKARTENESLAARVASLEALVSTLKKES